MNDEEFEEAEKRHAEGKMIAGVVTVAGAFVFFVVVGLGYL